MPIHNWSRVSDGMFHWFHQTWIVAIAKWLNEGRLPEGFYSIGEIYADQVEPDVLAVEGRPPETGQANGHASNGFGVALLESPPKTRFSWEAETESYLAKKDLIAVRSVAGILVAVIEIVSAGNNRASLASANFSRGRSSFWIKACMSSSSIFSADAARPAGDSSSDLERRIRR